MNTLSGKELSKIGIGSYGIGGRGHRDMELTEKVDDQSYIDALIYTLKKGVNFTEIALGYGHGNSLDLFKKALTRSGVDREDVFVTHSLYPRDLPDIQVIEKDTLAFYSVLETTYADSTLVTESLIHKFGEEEVFTFLHRLISENKTRNVSLSNSSLNMIRKYKQEFGDKFFAHEGHLSFEVRVLQDTGIFDECNQLGITNIIWRPLRRGKTQAHHWPILEELSIKYKKAPNQIVLNWMCHYGYRPMVMSKTEKHIDENVDATTFMMSEEDYDKINTFRPITVRQDTLDENNLVTLANDFENFEIPK